MTNLEDKLVRYFQRQDGKIVGLTQREEQVYARLEAYGSVTAEYLAHSLSTIEEIVSEINIAQIIKTFSGFST